jgi:ABC-type multidrug transport system fused ATPase/permease subunit
VELNLKSDINKDFAEYFNYNKVDRLLVKILWWHLAVVSLWVFAIVIFEPARYFQSPLSYRNLGLKEALSVVLIGSLASLSITLLKGRLKNHYIYRIAVTCALVVYSFLIVFMTGGSIEAHFHFFIVFALLCVYCDWRLGWIATLLTALHHGILNYIAPSWVYFYGRNDFSIIAHSLPVIVAVLFTTWICEIGRNNAKKIKEINLNLQNSSNELEKAKVNLEEQVRARTGELNSKLEELEKFNKMSVDRELKMVELKNRLKEMEKKSGAQ